MPGWQMQHNLSPSRNPLPQQIGAHHKRVKTRQSENIILVKIFNKYLTQIFQRYRMKKYKTIGT